MRKAKVGVGTVEDIGPLEAGDKGNELELNCFSAFLSTGEDVLFVDPHDNGALEQVVVNPNNEDQQRKIDRVTDPPFEFVNTASGSLVEKLARRTVAEIMASVGIGTSSAEDGDNEPLLKLNRVKKVAKRKVKEIRLSRDGDMTPKMFQVERNEVVETKEQETQSDEPRPQKESENERPLPARRNSTGNMQKNVNSENLKATIRRLQSRRHRPPRKSITVTVLQHFLAFLFYVGMSPLKPASAKNMPGWFLKLQIGFFATFVSISSAQAIGLVKDSWINFNFETDQISFINFGFLITNCISRLYNVYVLSTAEEETSQLLAKIDKINSRGRVEKRNWTRTVAISLGTLSMILVGVITIFGNIPLSDWTVEDAILDRSFEFSQTLFLWSTTDYENKTISWLANYGEQLIWTTCLLGAINTVIAYCASLHGCMMLDLWPIISLQVCILQSHFTEAIQVARDERQKRNPDGRLQCPLSIHWNYYMELREVCDQIDLVFGRQMKLIHMQNILLFGYYLMKLFKFLSADLLVDTFSVLKIAVTYYMVQNSADKNEKYESCVIECSELHTTIEMNGMERNVCVLLENMKRHPIGVGRGDFFVNQAFALKIVCAVGSIFMLLSEHLGKTSNKE